MTPAAAAPPAATVTGIGLFTPLGRKPGEVFAALTAGLSGIGTPPQGHPAHGWLTAAGLAPALAATEVLPPTETRCVDRFVLLALAAAADALADAGAIGADPARSAVVAGVGIGGLITLEEQIQIRVEKGPSRVSPFLVPMMMANATPALVSLQMGWTGPNLCIATACAASSNALGEAAELIRHGSADVVMALGAEACMTPTAIAAFARMTALSGRNDDPAHASRPFDADRDGFVMGEGGAALVLERWDAAVARGAHIYGELVGYGRNADAYHITAPSPGGEGAAACMQLALADAGLDATAIGHINAHGTSTPLNDAAESEAIHKVFGETPPPVTSTKGVTGHMIGAAGAVEAIAALLSIERGLVPPTANLERLDPEMHLDVVHGEPRAVAAAPALSNSFGFGGHNASIIVAPAS
jgi:3-oxoacyl-[acyl-carrier-protein] synthase II